MRQREWVVDTWVLEMAQRADDKGLTAVAFLHEILERHCIGVDHDGQIQREYQRHLPPRTLVSFWWISLVRRGKICRRSGRLPKAQSSHLLGKLRFDPSDIPFVAVAVKGEDKLLVSEDSDYGPEVKQYLTGLGVEVLALREALELARDP